MDKSLQILHVLALITLLLVVAIEPAAAKKQPEITSEKYFKFGMKYGGVDKMLEKTEDDWEIAYRINTPSTHDLACRWQERVQYLVRFYKERCYYIEKTAEVSGEDIARIFEYYFDKLGETPEASQSKDLRLFFARWTESDREIVLSASQRESGTYIVIYEEFAPDIVGEARYVQEKELANAPREIDPITGLPRPKIDDNEDGERKESDD